MATIGKIRVDLEGDTRRFQRSMRGATRQVESFRAQALRMARGLSILGGPLGLGLLIRRTAQEALRVKQLSDRVGTSAESFSRLARVLGRSGIRMDQTGVILQRLQRRAAEAAAGNEQLSAVFQELGIDIEAFVKLDPVEAFLRIGEALSGVDDNARKVLLAFKLLDTEGVQVLQTDLSALRGELSKTSGITDSQAEKVTRAAESWDRFKEAFSSAALTVAEELSVFSLLDKAAQNLTKFAESPFPSFREGIGQAGQAVIAGNAATLAAIAGLFPREPAGPGLQVTPRTQTGGSTEIVSTNLERSNRLLEQIRNNTAQPRPAVAQ